jgi:endonuclease/exonuclease/phosphatase family metal-dependent hydrolase
VQIDVKAVGALTTPISMRAVARHRTVHVIVVHLGLLRASRRRQALQLTDYIRREAGAHEPLVVAGDFNEQGPLLADLLAPAGLVSAQVKQGRVPTFPSRMPLLQLDHVFVRGLTCTGVQAPKGRIWWRMSDHLPLIADLHLP